MGTRDPRVWMRTRDLLGMKRDTGPPGRRWEVWAPGRTPAHLNQDLVEPPNGSCPIPPPTQPPLLPEALLEINLPPICYLRPSFIGDELSCLLSLCSLLERMRDHYWVPWDASRQGSCLCLPAGPHRVWGPPPGVSPCGDSPLSRERMEGAARGLRTAQPPHLEGCLPRLLEGFGEFLFWS